MKENKIVCKRTRQTIAKEKKSIEETLFNIRTEKINTENAKVFPNEKINCPICKADEITRLDGKFFGICDVCDCKYIFFNPTPIQQEIIKNNSYKMILYGSVGTGKTAVNAYRYFIHLTSIPNARIGIIANTIDQLNKTAKHELLKYFLKEDFIKFNNDMWVLKNGSEVLWLTSDDPFKTKSLNLSGAWAIECDTINEEVIKELDRRIRLQSACVYHKNSDGQYMVLKNGNKKIKYAKWIYTLESNISNSYLNEYICSGRKIYYSENVDIESYTITQFINQKNLVTFVISLYDSNTNGDIYLQKVISLCANEDEKRSTLNCNILRVTNMLFPNFPKCVMPPFNVKTNDYVYFSSTDFGANIGYTTFLVFAFNTRYKTCYLVEEYGNVKIPLKENIAEFINIKRRYPLSQWIQHICDSAGKQKLIVEGDKSVIDIANSLGFRFYPVPKSQFSKQEGINFLNKLIDEKRFFVFNNCVNTINFLSTAYKKKNKYDKYSYKSTIKNIQDDFFDSMVYAGNYLSMNYDDNKWKKFINPTIHTNIIFGKRIRWI